MEKSTNTANKSSLKNFYKKNKEY